MAGVFPLFAEAQTVKAVEYFFDNDPGLGNGTRISLNPATQIDVTINLNVNALSFGLHQLFLRALNDNNKWSLYHIYPVIIGSGNQVSLVQKVEYFFDSDPGIGNGKSINLSSSSLVDTSLNIDISSEQNGLHQLFIRSMDMNGKWSLYNTYPVIKGPGYYQPLTVNKLEYFIDSDPGVGRAMPVSLNPKFTVDSTFLLPIPNTSKDSIDIFVRAQDNRGLWSLYKDTIVAVTCNMIVFKPLIDYSPLLCGNTVVSFIDTTVGAQWKWNFGNGDSADSQNPVYDFKLPGTYKVSHYVVSSKGCTSDTANRIFTIEPPISVKAGPDRVINVGEMIKLVPVITGNDSSYLWTPNIYMNDNTLRNPTITGVDDIKYTIVVTGKGNCSASDSITIKVNKSSGPINVPNAFTPNGDGINDTWVIKYLNTYPDCRLQVFNRYGQLVFESIGYPHPWDGKFLGKLLPLGTYVYLINLNNGQKTFGGTVTIIY